jgi:hypothetical protein
MAHHRWVFSFSCPGCGRSGGVKVTEDSGPPFSDPPRREYEPDEGFVVTPGRRVTITCGTCGAVIPGPG